MTAAGIAAKRHQFALWWPKRGSASHLGEDLFKTQEY